MFELDILAPYQHEFGTAYDLLPNIPMSLQQEIGSTLTRQASSMWTDLLAA